MRQSLAALRALTVLVESNLPEHGNAAYRLRLMRSEVDWLADLVSSMDTSDGDLDLVLVDVGEVVASACNSVIMSTSCPVSLSKGPSVMAITEEVALRRSVRNLLDNAVRAAGPDGHVEVTVRRVGSRVDVQVLDDGPGFGRVPVQQGLGLVTVRRFASRARGSLDVDEGRLGGACLTLSIPATVTDLILQRNSA